MSKLFLEFCKQHNIKVEYKENKYLMSRYAYVDLFMNYNLTEEFIIKYAKEKDFLILCRNKSFNFQKCSSKFKLIYGKYFK